MSHRFLTQHSEQGSKIDRRGSFSIDLQKEILLLDLTGTDSSRVALTHSDSALSVTGQAMFTKQKQETRFLSAIQFWLSPSVFTTSTPTLEGDPLYHCTLFPVRGILFADTLGKQ